MAEKKDRRVREQPVAQVTAILVALGSGFGASYWGMPRQQFPTTPQYMNYGVLAERIASNERMIEYYMKSTDRKIEDLKKDIRARLPLKATLLHSNKGENDG